MDSGIEPDQFRIDCLQGESYEQVSTSPTFPRLPIPELVAEVLAGSSKMGRSPALRAFRQKITQLLS